MANFLYKELTSSIIGGYFEVYKTFPFRRGYTVSELKRAMGIELENRGLRIQEQVLVKRRYKGAEIGWGVADMVVDDKVIVMVTNVDKLSRVHDERLRSFLTHDWQVGLAFNFGSPTPNFHRRDASYIPQRGDRP